MESAAITTREWKTVRESAADSAADSAVDSACMGTPHALFFAKILEPTFQARGTVCSLEEGGVIFCPRQ